MQRNTMTSRVARRYMKQASLPDLTWGIDQMEGVALTLKDIAAVWMTRTPGTPGIPEEPSLSDSYPQVQKAAKLLQSMAQKIAQEADRLRTIKGSPVERRASSTLRKLDRQMRSEINRKLERVGLDGNGRFEKAEHGLARAFKVLAEYGIEPDEVVNSFVFTRPEGRVNVDIAFTGEDVFRPEPITNSMLTLSFYERAPYNFEVLAYLS